MRENCIEFAKGIVKIENEISGWVVNSLFWVNMCESNEVLAQVESISFSEDKKFSVILYRVGKGW